jgi:hypothetical protein
MMTPVFVLDEVVMSGFESDLSKFLAVRNLATVLATERGEIHTTLVVAIPLECFEPFCRALQERVSFLDIECMCRDKLGTCPRCTFANRLTEIVVEYGGLRGVVPREAESKFMRTFEDISREFGVGKMR